MLKLKPRKYPATVLADASPHRRREPRYGPAQEQALVEHDLVSAADLGAIRPAARAARMSPIALLIQRGVSSAHEVDRCLQTAAWLRRPAAEHLTLVTSDQAMARHRREFEREGYFVIPNFLPAPELRALDLALHRISLAHVDQSPAKHKLYHSIGGQLLYEHQPVVDLNGHPELLKIAKAFLGDDLVQGKHYLKVDDPYQFKGMFGHTHAESHFDCLSHALFMFLYLDATDAFGVIPGSHGWYSRGADGRTVYDGRPLPRGKEALTHDAEIAHRWSGYQSLDLPANTLVALSPFLWHAVRPVQHRRRLMFMGYFDARALTREFVLGSDYFGDVPYDLRVCDLKLLSERQQSMLAIHLDREKWLAERGL